MGKASLSPLPPCFCPPPPRSVCLFFLLSVPFCPVSLYFSLRQHRGVCLHWYPSFVSAGRLQRCTRVHTQKKKKERKTERKRTHIHSQARPDKQRSVQEADGRVTTHEGTLRQKDRWFEVNRDISFYPHSQEKYTSDSPTVKKISISLSVITIIVRFDQPQLDSSSFCFTK